MYNILMCLKMNKRAENLMKEDTNNFEDTIKFSKKYIIQIEIFKKD